MTETLTSPVEARNANIFDLPENGSVPVGRNETIITEQEMIERGLAPGCRILADLEVAEHTFAPGSKFSIVEVTLPSSGDPNKSDRRTFLVGMQGDTGQEKYVRGSEVDISDMTPGHLELEQARRLGITERTARAFTIGNVFGGFSISVTRSKGEGHVKVVTATDKQFGDHKLNNEDQQPRPTESSWNYTIDARELAEIKDYGRPQIGHDTRLQGGVYVTGNREYGAVGEAIVVDDTYDQKWLKEFMNRVQQGSRSYQGDRSLAVVKSAYHFVRDTMSYASDEEIDTILAEFASSQGDTSFEDGRKIPLNEFVKNKKGKCRHQSLELARGLEAMVDASMLAGKVSIDRNKLWNPLEEKYEGHAWVRFTATNGDVYILDVARGYFGLLRDSKSQAQWNYYRLEDKGLESSRLAVQRSYQ